MLSSLYQQKGMKDKFEITVDIAHSIDNGIPKTEEVIDFFNGLGEDVRSRPYPDYSRLQYRGMTRSDQMKCCESDFMLFADCDMVYHPRFFSNLFDLLDKDDEFSNYGGVMTCGRFSQPNELIEKTNEFIGDIFSNSKLKLVQGIWDLSNANLDKVPRSNVGAGFWQLINFDKCDHSGYYVSDQDCRDRGWEGRGQKAKSDQQFRRRIGEKKKLPKWFCDNQIHLNHFRDNQFDEHLVIQR